MKAQIVEMEAFTVAGVIDTFTDDEEQVGKLWQKYASKGDEIKDIVVDPRAFGVSFNTGTKGEWDYIAGQLITPEKADSLPEGLVSRHVPTQRFAFVETTIDTMEEGFSFIDEEWLPSSPYERDDSGPTLDVYHVDESGKHRVGLYVPLK